MQPVDFSILATPTFTFFVGKKKERFNLHVGAVGRYSRPLEVLMTGVMSESQLGHAHLPEVDADIFGRFAQFVYQGDYGRSIRINPRSEEGINFLKAYESGDSQTFENALPRLESEIRVKRVPSLEANRKFFSLPGTEYLNLAYRREKSLIFLFQHEQGSKAALQDAKTYVFADTYQIEPLRKIALAKTRECLCTNPMKTSHLIELAEYTMRSTIDSMENPDELRWLVTVCLASVIERLLVEKEFMSLLHEVPSLSIQLIPLLTQRTMRNSVP